MQNTQDSQSDVAVFKSVMKDLLISIKNATLYDTDHPIFILSIKKFKKHLDQWLETHANLEFGVSSNHLIFDQEVLAGGEQYLDEIAGLIHTKGILSVKLSKHLQLFELVHFIDFLKIERRFKADFEDNESRFLQFPNIRIKEIDFSSLLTNKEGSGGSEEEKIWSFIYGSEDDPELLNQNIGSLIRFVKQTDSSASFLNRIYREAVRKEADEQVTGAVRHVLYKLCQYFDHPDKADSNPDFKADMLGLLSKLHPDMLVNMFQETQIEGQKFDLSKQILNDFSDMDIAQFLETLIREEGSINEHLVRIFQKIVPDGASADRITPLVADQILGRQLNSIQQIQISIKELFQNHPENCFLNEMYKITVEVLSETDQNKLRYSIKLGPLINLFVKSYDEERFRKEHSWICLKLLSKETNFIEYKKYAQILFQLFKELLAHRDVAALKNLYAYQQHILRNADNDPPELRTEKRAFGNLISGDEIIASIIQMIPDADGIAVNDIVNILVINKPKAAALLLRAYLDEKRPATRKKMLYAIKKMKHIMGETVIRCMDQTEPHVIRELLNILKVCDPDRINIMAKKMLNNADTHVLWEALSHYVPATAIDREEVFKLITFNSNPEIQRKAALCLLKTNHETTIEKLLQLLHKKRSRIKYFMDILKHCGELSLSNAFQPLTHVYLKRVFLFKKRYHRFRLTALNSLLKIDSEKTQHFVSALGGAQKKMFIENHRHEFIKWVNQ